MWDEHKPARFQACRQRALDGVLTVAEHAAIRQMMQEVVCADAVYLRPATGRLGVARERFEAHNRALQAMVQRQEAFAMRLRAVLAELETERQALDVENLPVSPAKMQFTGDLALEQQRHARTERGARRGRGAPPSTEPLTPAMSSATATIASHHAPQGVTRSACTFFSAIGTTRRDFLHLLQ